MDAKAVRTLAWLRGPHPFAAVCGWAALGAGAVAHWAAVGVRWALG